MTTPTPATTRRPTTRRMPSYRGRNTLTTPEAREASSARADANIALWHAVQRGERGALDRMVEANDALVHDWAFRYERKGLPKDDGVQEGRLGLLHAIRKYNPELRSPTTGQPYTFATYAVYWIRHYLARALQDERIWFVHIPVYIHTKAWTLHHAGQEEKITVGRDTVDMAHFAPIISLDRTLRPDHDDEYTLGSTPADETQAPPEQAMEREEATRFLSELMLAAGLTDRERQVLGLRFGVLGYGEPMRMATSPKGAAGMNYPSADGVCRVRNGTEVGQIIGTCRERVRQIEEHALTKLRAYAQRSSHFRRDLADMFSALDQSA